MYFSQQFLKNLSCSETREAIQPAFNEKELNRILLVASAYHDSKASRNLLHFLDNKTTKKEFGIECLGALYFPDTHLVNIAESCRLLADHPGIEVIKREAPKEVDFVACASASKRFTSTEELEIGEIAGQLDFIGIPDTSPLKKDTLVHGSGYVIQSNTEWVIGSTYEQKPWSSAAASEFNIEKNRKFLGNSPVSFTRQLSCAPLRFQRQGPCNWRIEQGSIFLDRARLHGNHQLSLCGRTCCKSIPGLVTTPLKERASDCCAN
ncbi:MAG: hypothetical protein CM15mP3_10310 [Candidatus Poseidoniales archaeon]|nr:MAG: hypothetical protein CM15mP3_10310 [Candidatus Poseidoniales archaeon]